MLQEWDIQPTIYTVQPYEVHVWRINLESSFEVEQAFRNILSQDELERADRFIQKKHGLLFSTGRAVLRYLLGRYCQMTPDKIQFTYNDFGKPSLADTTFGIEFNVSNTKALGVIAVTVEHAVGVDVEQHRESLDLEKLARRYFSPNEVQALFALKPEQRVDAFYRCWSSKEAFMKACGRGLSLGLNRFDVEIDPANPPRLLRVPEEMGDAAQWEMAALPMGDHVAGVLSLEGTLEQVNLFELDPASLL